MHDIATLTAAETLVELGSGTSEKTRLLLEALTSAGTLQRFVPFDVDPAVLEDASTAVAQEFPTLEVEPVVGDFERHLGELPQHPRRLLAFLGSTIGNLDPGQRATFLGDVRRTLHSGDAFLLGTDLVKDPARLVAAYDDARGVTAEFNKNVLSVLNRELGADFDLDAFEHVAVWDADREWIEMRLESVRAQTVRLEALDLEVQFAGGRAGPHRDLGEVPARGDHRRARRRWAGRHPLVDRPGGRLRAVAVGARLKARILLLRHRAVPR